jgi:hypothetical protein
MSNAAKIKFIPIDPPSAFGYSVDMMSMAPELGGAMLKLGFSTNQGEFEIRCTYDWAEDLADRIKAKVQEDREICRKEGTIIFQAKA